MNCAETMDQFRTPCELNIPLSDARNINIIKTTMVPIIPPSSGRIREFLKADISLTRSSGIDNLLFIKFTLWSLHKKGAELLFKKLRPS
jgi:hypothetical protein